MNKEYLKKYFPTSRNNILNLSTNVFRKKKIKKTEDYLKSGIYALQNLIECL